jgi:putative membrane protein
MSDQVISPPTQTDRPSTEPIAETPRHRSRVGATWVALVVFLVILIGLIIFILQNSQNVKVSFLGFAGNLSFGVALISAAVIGSVLTVLIGSVRIIQLKLRKH